MKLIIGIWIDASGLSKAQEQVDQIKVWARWDLVELCVVGNEAIFSGYVSATELAGFISSTASELKGAGYTGPITTTEPPETWQQYPDALCGVVDILGSNIHAYFNSDVSAPTAGPFIASVMAMLGTVCPGKEVLNVECGWPNYGDPNGAAIPGESQQIAALSSIEAAIGDKVVFFSYANQPWKSAGSLNVEKSWGCINSFN